MKYTLGETDFNNNIISIIRSVTYSDILNMFLIQIQVVLLKC